MEKISIIIPCYNGARVLRRCFNSVLAQTYTDFEVVFVNDASTDCSMEIAREYAARDSRFRLIEQPCNKGVSAARNVGMRHVNGAYIQFMDADDELMPDTLETLHNALCARNADMAVCNFVGNPIFLAFLQDRVFDMTVRSDVLEYYQSTFGLVLPWNKLFRREALTVCFDESVHFAEDELFNLSVLRGIRRIASVQKPLYVYHFAPAEKVIVANADSKSCLNKIIDETNEQAQNSIWYMGRELLPKRREILENGLRSSHVNFDTVEDLLYTRVFDFLFWELSAFAYMQTSREIIVKEFINILQDDTFIRSMQVQERYGVQYRLYDAEELEQLVKRYIDLCLTAYACIHENELPINFYHVFLMLFSRMFCTLVPRTCREYNQLFRLMREMQTNSSPEAEFTTIWLKNAMAAEVESA